ncbi:hypothetical protein ACX0MV_06055 [Pseudomonas borbori]
MSYKSMLVALLGLSLTGCAVYGGEGGYGHRGYDRNHSTTYYHVQRYPVYVVPGHKRHHDYRHDRRRYDDYHRHAQRHYAPAPHHYYRVQPRAGWDDRRHGWREHGHRQHSRDSRRDGHRGWERRN